MTGAECLLKTLVANQVEVCFSNPGTSEMHFIAALDHVPEMRGILCLYEGVCSGAADGYARMAGKPASVLLHLGPGLANSLSNLHNARKAGTPLVVIVGEHSTAHLKYDAPLTSDIAAFARTVSTEVRTVSSSASIGEATAETVAAAQRPPGQVAVLIVPGDYSWLPSDSPVPVAPPPARCPAPLQNIDAAVHALRAGKAAGMVLGGSVMANPHALEAAGKIAGSTGTRVFADRNAPRLAAGRGRFQVEKVPYFPEDAGAALDGLTELILVEAQAPVSFFGYPDTPGSPVPADCEVVTLAARNQDGTAALKYLVQALGVQNVPVPGLEWSEVTAPTEGPMNIGSIGRTLAALMPENAIVSDEMISSSAPMLPYLAQAAAHDQLTITGGAIGQGLPVAVGAAVACPDRKVLALEADGSAMYSLQSLWTMARQNLDVLTVIFANRRYRILDIEMRRTGARATGKRANDMLDLGRPELDFVSMARGMGVAATRATTAAEFTAQFRAAVGERGPRLIEAVL